MYSSKLGRFIARDPLGYVDGMGLYHGYFVPHGVDPTGMRKLRRLVKSISESVKSAIDQVREETERAAQRVREETEQAAQRVREETERAAQRAREETERAIQRAREESERAREDAARLIELGQDEAGKMIRQVGDSAESLGSDFKRYLDEVTPTKSQALGGVAVGTYLGIEIAKSVTLGYIAPLSLPIYVTYPLMGKTAFDSVYNAYEGGSLQSSFGAAIYSGARDNESANRQQYKLMAEAGNFLAEQAVDANIFRTPPVNPE